MIEYKTCLFFYYIRWFVFEKIMLLQHVNYNRLSCKRHVEAENSRKTAATEGKNNKIINHYQRV